MTRAIIATDPSFSHHLVQYCKRFRYPTREIQTGERIYLTFPHPNREGESGVSDESPLTKLVALEVGSILPFTVQAVTEAVLPGPPPSPPPPVEPDPANVPIFAAIVRENVRLMGTAEVIRRMALVPKPAT